MGLTDLLQRVRVPFPYATPGDSENQQSIDFPMITDDFGNPIDTPDAQGPRPRFAPPEAPKRGFLGGLRDIVAGGINAAATPNIAYGGPTDLFRSIQAASGAKQHQDLLQYNLNRQRHREDLQDAESMRKARHDEEINRHNMERERTSDARTQASEQRNRDLTIRQAIAKREAKLISPEEVAQLDPVKRGQVSDQGAGTFLYYFTPEEQQTNQWNDPAIQSKAILAGHGALFGAKKSGTISGEPQVAPEQPPDQIDYPEGFVGPKQEAQGSATPTDMLPQAPDVPQVPGSNAMRYSVPGMPPRGFTAIPGTERGGQQYAVGGPEAGKIEIESDIAEKIGIPPNEEGKYFIDPKSFVRMVGNQTKTKPTNTIDLAVAAEGGDTSAQGALNRLHPPKEPRAPSETASNKAALAAARNRVFADSGNNWKTATENIAAGKYNADPAVSPHLSEISDHAEKQAGLQTKQNELKATAAAMATRADATMTAGGRIQKKIDDMQRLHPQYFGPLAGRAFGAGGLKLNALPPDLQNLITELHSFFALQPAQHGFRAKSAMDAFEQSAGADRAGVFVNPRGVKGGIQGIMQINKDLREGLKTGRYPQGVEPPPEVKGATVPDAATPAAGGPQKGTTKPYNGHTYTFDGSQWVLTQ